MYVLSFPHTLCARKLVGGTPPAWLANTQQQAPPAAHRRCGGLSRRGRPAALLLLLLAACGTALPLPLVLAPSPCCCSAAGTTVPRAWRLRGALSCGCGRLRQQIRPGSIAS